MTPLRELGRLLLMVGVVLTAVGALFYFSGRLPFRLGRLPGDLSWQGKNTSVYFPIVTCIILSIALSAIFWLVSHFRR